jgi:hypothetical protein
MQDKESRIVGLLLGGDTRGRKKGVGKTGDTTKSRAKSVISLHCCKA